MSLPPMSLADWIERSVFFPEVYAYPPPRCLREDVAVDPSEIQPGQETNLYLHIPFCRSICAYCGYLKMLDDASVRSSYVDALAQEIRSRGAQGRGARVHTIHVGGGTPSLLGLDQVRSLVRAVQDAFPGAWESAEEISIEATPDSLDRERIAAYLDLGFNRISIGVQTLCADELALARRAHTEADAEQAITLMRVLGVPNVVVDLMIGIASQTVASFDASVRRIIACKPDTVELYALGAMPFTGWQKKRADFMPASDIFECYRQAMRRFVDAGYGQDCHNRYALPGTGGFLQEDLVFRGQSLLGFGAGARTYTDSLYCRNSYTAYQHRAAILRYVETVQRGRSSIESAFRLTLEEQARRFAIYNIERLDLDELRRFGEPSVVASVDALANELLGLGFATVHDGILELNKEGFVYRDVIAHALYSPAMAALDASYRPTV